METLAIILTIAIGPLLVSVGYVCGRMHANFMRDDAEIAKRQSALRSRSGGGL